MANKKKEVKMVKVWGRKQPKGKAQHLVPNKAYEVTEEKAKHLLANNQAAPSERAAKEAEAKILKTEVGIDE